MVRLSLTLLNLRTARRRVAEAVAYGKHPRQKLDIYRRGAAPGLPVILFFYGGGWRMGERSGFGFVGSTLSAEAVVVIADYRLYPEVRFPAFIEDGASALAWVREQIAGYGGDPERIYVCGHSAGAHLGAFVAFDERYRGDLPVAGFIGLSGPYEFRVTNPIHRRVFESSPTPEWQPARHISEHPPKALLIHGGLDTIVEPGNAERMRRAIEAQAGRVEVRLHRRLEHFGTLLALSWPMGWIAPVRREIARFLKD